MSLPGYRITLKASGTPTATTGNGFDATAVVNQYQINSTAKRVFAREVSPSAFKATTGGAAISSTDILSVDYLLGKVTFKTTHGSSVVGTVTHLPLVSVVGANSMTLSGTRELLDDTDFTSTGFRSRQVGLMDINLSISRWDTIDQTWAKRFLSTSVLSTGQSTGSNQVVAEIRTETTGKYGIGYFRLENETKSGDVSGLEQSDLTLQLDGDSNAAFRWSDS